MSALPETQRRVMGALRGRGALLDARSDATSLVKSRGLSAAQRLQVYRNNMHESLGNALSAVYPVVTQLVGDDYFRQVARIYVAKHPLHASNLHGYGHKLPDVLAALPSAAALPYLADVASLEWAWHEVYHEAESVALDPAQLGEVPAAQQMDLGLQLAAATRLVASPFPVLRIWQVHQADIDDDFKLALDEGGVRLLLVRRALEIDFVLLSSAEDRWLRALASGATLAAATAGAFEVDPAFDLVATLGRHLALGTFAALSFAALSLASAETAGVHA